MSVHHRRLLLWGSALDQLTTVDRSASSKLVVTPEFEIL